MSNSEPPIERFAELIVGFGANVQPGQTVELSASPGKEDLARAIAGAAYRRGAKEPSGTRAGPSVKRRNERTAASLRATVADESRRAALRVDARCAAYSPNRRVSTSPGSSPRTRSHRANSSTSER